MPWVVTRIEPLELAWMNPYVRAMTDQPEFEELEHIPWAALAAKRPDPRLRIGAIVAVGVVAVAAGLYVASQWPGGEASTPAPIAIATTTTTTQVALVSSVPSVELPGAEPPPPAATAGMYTEADLMLINVAEEERLAVLHAEWFVRDYLTIDGDGLVADRIAALLPQGTPAPLDAASSYVEWVRAYAASTPTPGTYRIEVAYRLLVGTEDGYVREPAGAVAVEIALGSDGSATLQTVPEAIAVPNLLAIEERPG